MSRAEAECCRRSWVPPPLPPFGTDIVCLHGQVLFLVNAQPDPSREAWEIVIQLTVATVQANQSPHFHLTITLRLCVGDSLDHFLPGLAWFLARSRLGLLSVGLGKGTGLHTCPGASILLEAAITTARRSGESLDSLLQDI